MQWLASCIAAHWAHCAGTEAPLLQDISFRVPAKKLGLIYGRSGAGKTTLLQLIAGLTTPTSGTICITETAGVVHTCGLPHVKAAWKIYVCKHCF